MGYEIPGIGVIGGDIVAAILDKFDTPITRVLLDERTGVVIETSLDTYRPNRAMRRFIQKRDGHCRFPGCTRNAKHCEPDHIIPYSQGGPTAPWNLASLCKHHHRVKHNAGWTLTMTRDGHCTWTDLDLPRFRVRGLRRFWGRHSRGWSGAWWCCRSRCS